MAPPRTIVIEVGDRFGVLADRRHELGQRFAERLGSEISTCWRRLSIAPPPLFTVRAAGIDDVIRVRIGRRIIRCPEAIAQATCDYFLCDESTLPVLENDWPSEIAGRLLGSEATRALAVCSAVAAIAGRIIEDAADDLLGLDDAIPLAQAIQAAGHSSITATWLVPVMKATTRLGVEISDIPKVVGNLARIVASGYSDLDVGEVLASRLRSRQIVIEVNPEYFESITGLYLEEDVLARDQAAPAVLREAFNLMADGLFYELGLRIPAIRLAPVEDLMAHQIRILIGDLTPLRWVGLPPDRQLVADTSAALASEGIAAFGTVNPANGRSCAIATTGERGVSTRQTWSPAGYLVLVTAGELRRRAHLLVDIDLAERELAALRGAFPALVLTALERVAVRDLVRVMRLLLREGLGIRNLRSILETFLSVGNIGSLDWEDPELSAERVAAAIRVAVPNWVTHQYVQAGKLKAYLLDSALERELEWLVRRRRAVSNYDKRETEIRRERIRVAIGNAISPREREPRVILARSALRFCLSSLVVDQRPNLVVLAHEELPPGLSIEPVMTISAAPPGHGIVHNTSVNNRA